MKTAKINILGREHTLCFSARVAKRCIEEFGSIDAMLDTLVDNDSGKVLNNALWLLSTMLDAGRRYVRQVEDQEEPIITQEDLFDIFSPDDLSELSHKLLAAITGGSSREVEVEPKNAEATQAAVKGAKASRG